MNENESINDIENSLAACTPVELKTSVGTVMYEAGRAVGRQEASSQNRSVTKPNRIWQLATAASLTLAIIGFAQGFNSDVPTPLSNSTASAESKAKESTEPSLAETAEQPPAFVAPIPQPTNFTHSSHHRSYTIFPTANVPEPNLVKLQRKLLNQSFGSSLAVSPTSSRFLYQPVMTVRELTQKFNNEQGTF